MANFITLSDLDSFQLQDVRHTAGSLAENAVDPAGNPVDDGTPVGFDRRIALTHFLADEAERWASFDEADQDDLSYEIVIADFFAQA